MQLKTTLIGTGTLALAASLTLGRVARAISTTASGKRAGPKGTLVLVTFPNGTEPPDMPVQTYKWPDVITLAG